MEWKLEWHCSNSRNVGRLRWSHGLIYYRSMLKYKVIKFPPWLFSKISNTAMIRKTHAPDSHRLKFLPLFCLLSWRPWKIQATAGATVEWQLEWQRSNSRSVGRVIRSHGLSYNCSILEYIVIKFPPWMFSTISNTAIGKKTHTPDIHQWKPLPWFYFLRRLPWTIQVTEGATVEWQL